MRCPSGNCTAHFSSLKQQWLATHFWTCWKTGCYHNWMPVMAIMLYNWTGLPLPPCSHECTSASQSRSSTALDRTGGGGGWCKMETIIFSWPPRSPNLTPCDFFLWWSVKDSVYVPPLPTSIQELACTAGHYSGQATPSLVRVWLPRGCVPCDPRCTHWRIVISAWETWTVAAADSVCCSRAGWEIHFVFTSETAPFCCVCLYFYLLNVTDIIHIQ
jgi:hypothetical protein